MSWECLALLYHFHDTIAVHVLAVLSYVSKILILIMSDLIVLANIWLLKMFWEETFEPFVDFVKP